MHSSSLNLNLNSNSNSNWNRNSTVLALMGYSLIGIAYRLHRQTDGSFILRNEAYTNLQIVMREKKEAKFINLCVLSSCLLCDDNNRPQMLNRQMTEMNDDLMRGYALFFGIVYWHDAPQFVTNEFCDWIYPTHSHTHISLQCIQKQQQQLGDRVEFNLPNNRKLKLRLCKTDSIWKLIDSYVNIFFLL